MRPHPPTARHGIAATVYDRDSGPSDRDQGGTLDLHEDNGQVALKDAGLLDEFFRLARPEGQEMRTYNAADGTLSFHDEPDPEDVFAPEIDRGELRDLLLNSLEPGTVRWNHTLDHIAGRDAGPRRLHFRDGTVVEADLVIGADGAWSKVRKILSAATPGYTGISFLEAWFHDVEHRHPDVDRLVGGGSAVTADGERCLFAQRNGGSHIRVYIIQQVPADWLAREGLTSKDTEQIRTLLRDRFQGWNPALLRLVTDNDGEYVDRPIYALPVPHTWDTNATVTLLGDAAHLMPPLGVGVNLAMLDARDLALAIVTHDTVAAAVDAYEKTMVPRSHEMQAQLDGAAAGLLSNETLELGRIDAD